MDESSESEDETGEFPKDTEPLSEKDINEISAKILRAELLGDEVGFSLFLLYALLVAQHQYCNTMQQNYI